MQFIVPVLVIDPAALQINDAPALPPPQIEAICKPGTSSLLTPKPHEPPEPINDDKALDRKPPEIEDPGDGPVPGKPVMLGAPPLTQVPQ